MKKLMFATALVASVAAFANPINAISFEGYSDGDSVLGANGVPKTDTADPSGTTAGMYFWYQGDADSSTVKAYGVNDNLPLPGANTPRPLYFANAGVAQSKYLNLETEGGTLWRSIGTVNTSGATPTNGAPVAVAATGTYLDTLVQFTATEDQGPEDSLTDQDKLAIWLQADSNNNTTNLMVRAGLYDDSGTPIAGGATFVITGKTVVASEWYRLTVKAVDDILPANESFKIPGFQIFIDSVPMAATTAPISATFVGALREAEMITAEQAAAINCGAYLPSLVAGTPHQASTLEGVGFKGSGALDDIVWTTDDPFPAATVNFTLTWGEGVSAVSYTFGDFSTTNSLPSGTAVQLPVGDGTAQIELIPTFASGYVFDKVTMGGDDLGLTFAIPSVTTNATLLAKLDTPAYPSYLDTADATIKAKYNAWKDTYGADANSQYETAFLLNMNPATSIPVGTPLLKIASITEVSGGWELEIVSGATTLTAVDDTPQVGNGYLAITYAADLATLASGGTTVNLPVTVTGDSGKITVTVTAEGAKFMKATLSATAEPQN